MKIVVASSKDWIFQSSKTSFYKELDIENIKSKNKLNIINLKKINQIHLLPSLVES